MLVVRSVKLFRNASQQIIMQPLLNTVHTWHSRNSMVTRVWHFHFLFYMTLCMLQIFIILYCIFSETAVTEKLLNLETILWCSDNAQELWQNYSLCSIRQESLANAKVNARQQCTYENPSRKNLRRTNARNIMLKSTFSGLQHCCCLRSF